MSVTIIPHFHDASPQKATPYGPGIWFPPASLLFPNHVNDDDILHKDSLVLQAKSPNPFVR